MGERDPGNKPKAGDRIGFAYRVLPEHMLKDKDNVYKSGPRKVFQKTKKFYKAIELKIHNTLLIKIYLWIMNFT